MLDAQFVQDFTRRKADDSLVGCLLKLFDRAKQEGKEFGIGELVCELLRAKEAESILPRAALSQLEKRIADENLLVRLSDASSVAFLLQHSVKITERMQIAKVNVPTLIQCVVSFPDARSVPMLRLQEILRDSGIPSLGPARPPEDSDFRYSGLGYGIDLSRKMESISEPPLFGREAELNRLMQVLLAFRSPILTGSPGVGKSALIEGLAWLLRHPTAAIPEELWNLRIVSVQVSDLIAGSSVRGSLEQRLNDFVEHLSANPNVVAFIDEIHSLIAGGNDSGQVIIDTIKPGLARGTVRIIGATTEQEYQRYFAGDRALRERFRDIRLEEPSRDEAMKILRRRGTNLFAEPVRRRGVQLDDSAIEAAVDLSLAHFRDYGFPRKPIWLLQEAAAQKAFDLATSTENEEQSPYLLADDVAEIAADELGLPKEALNGGAQARLMLLQEALSQDLVGQSEARDAILQCMCGSFSGLGNVRRPLSVMLFYGSPGVGKTTATRTIARVVCGSELAVLDVNMTDYQDQNAVSKFAGSGPGYRDSGESWTLFTSVRSRPSMVVVLDHIHTLTDEMRRIISNVLDGYASDGMGRYTDFSKCVFVLIASHPFAKLLEDADSQEEFHRILESCLGSQISSKIDRTINFDGLTKEEMQAIIKLHVNDRRNQIGQQDDVSRRVLSRFEEESMVNDIIDEAIKLGGNGNSLEAALRRAIQTVAWQQMELQPKPEGESQKVLSPTTAKGSQYEF